MGEVGRTVFEVIEGDPQDMGKRIVVSKNDAISFGRSHKGDVSFRVHGDRKVSIRHAEILFRKQRYWIRDCNSSNGTFFSTEKEGMETMLQPFKREEITLGCTIRMGIFRIVCISVIIPENTETLSDLEFCCKLKVTKYFGKQPLREMFYDVPDYGCSIGRSVENGIQIDLKNISSQHTLLYRKGSHYYITDLGSANGTFLNDTKVLQKDEVEIVEGDRIKLGLHPNTCTELQVLYDFKNKARANKRTLSRRLSTMSMRFDRKRESDVEASPPPVSLDFMNQRMTLEFILNNETGLRYFMRYLRKCFNDENLAFYLAAKQFKEIKSSKKVHETAKKLYDEYIRLDAPHELNLSLKQRKGVEDELEGATTGIFNSLMKDIEQSMKYDNLPRFYQDPLARELYNIEFVGDLRLTRVHSMTM